MDFQVTEEDRALRSAVRAISTRYGNEYYAKKAEAREFTDELWLELGAHGYKRGPERAVCAQNKECL